MDFEYIVIFLLIIIAAILLYFGFTHFIKNKDLKGKNASSIDVEGLILALGGKENIKSVRSSPSKLTVNLLENKKADIGKIQSLGASGIVEGKDSLSMIFGKQSPLIEEDLKSLL